MDGVRSCASRIFPLLRPLPGGTATTPWRVRPSPVRMRPRAWPLLDSSPRPSSLLAVFLASGRCYLACFPRRARRAPGVPGASGVPGIPGARRAPRVPSPSAAAASLLSAAPLFRVFSRLFGLVIIGLLGAGLPGTLLLFPGDRILVTLHHFAVVDRAAPALDVVRVQQDLAHQVPPEVLQFQAGPPALRPPDVPGVLEHALRVVLEDHEDPGQVGRQFVEGHGAVDVALRRPSSAR